jgi:quercetin dioxygenase-like cupin family protein
MKIIKSNKLSWIDKVGYSKKIFVTDKDVNQPGALAQELKIAPGQIAKSHYHRKQTEIFYFLNTSGEFFVNGKKADIQKGDILIIEPNDRHETRNDSKEDFLYVGFKVNFEQGDFYDA